jgi:hypothetical protein
MDVSDIIVAWAQWSVKHNKQWNYTEGAQRMQDINHAGILPVFADCSAAVTLWYNWAGAPDPNGQGYNHTGYTGTLLANGKHIDISLVKPGDVVVYGPGTGVHTALIVQVRDKDILTVSHGQQGDPSYVWCGTPSGKPLGYPADTRTPRTFLRFNTNAIAQANIHRPS